MSPTRRSFTTATLVVGLFAFGGDAVRAANDISAAEQALFINNHLAKLRPPLTLRYGYHKAGTLEAAFDDSVDVMLTAQPDGTCCAASCASRWWKARRRIR
jgi:hypothetical protein